LTKIQAEKTEKVHSGCRPVALFSLALGLLTFLAQAEFSQGGKNSPVAAPRLLVVQAAEVAAGNLAGRFPRGSRIVQLQSGAPAQPVVNLTQGFFAAADPSVSPDAAKVLFAGRKTARGPWQIWEMKADGSGKRQVTHADADCLQPVFLPGNQIAYTRLEARGAGAASQAYVADSDGGHAHPITFGPGGFQVESVLRDGRILLSASWPLNAAPQAGAARALYVIRTDGSALNLFRQGASGSAVDSASELSDGSLIFVQSGGQGWHGWGGQLAWVQPGRLHSQPITQPGEVFASVHALDGDRVVVSRKTLLTNSSGARFDLYSFNTSTRKLGSALYRDPQYSSLQAVALEPRPTARYYWTILHYDLKTGRLICLDAYQSQDAPGGRLAGTIAAVRVLGLEGGQGGQRVLGTAPVESDGSFYMTVPADLPVRFELLDGKGKVLRAQQSWVWTRPGEDRGCTGCHEDKAQVPANHWPLILKRFDVPTPVGLNASAGAKP
jgi:hypothetical protein